MPRRCIRSITSTGTANVCCKETRYFITATVSMRHCPVHTQHFIFIPPLKDVVSCTANYFRDGVHSALWPHRHSHQRAARLLKLATLYHQHTLYKCAGNHLPKDHTSSYTQTRNLQLAMQASMLSLHSRDGMHPLDCQLQSPTNHSIDYGTCERNPFPENAHTWHVMHWDLYRPTSGCCATEVRSDECP